MPLKSANAGYCRNVGWPLMAVVLSCAVALAAISNKTNAVMAIFTTRILGDTYD